MNAISENDTAFLDYIEEQQRVACRLAGIALAIETLAMNDLGRDAILPLASVVHELAQGLYLSLDRVGFPQPTQQPSTGG